MFVLFSSDCFLKFLSYVNEVLQNAAPICWIASCLWGSSFRISQFQAEIADILALTKEPT